MVVSYEWFYRKFLPDRLEKLRASVENSLVLPTTDASLCRRYMRRKGPRMYQCYRGGLRVVVGLESGGWIMRTYDADYPECQAVLDHCRMLAQDGDAERSDTHAQR